MIGQVNLQSRIEQMISDGTFPRFSILVGPKGSGKKTLAHWIYQKLGAGTFINLGISVDTVRQCIIGSYRLLGTQAVYLFADADNMSNAAKNALLKVTEEPPNEAYFIMTLEDENNTPETIRSRGTVFHMDRYTPTEIGEYYSDNYFNEDDACWGSREAIIKKLCETPGEVDILSKDVLLFYDFVQLVVDNIAEVQLANAFKISEKIALKDGAEGYDLKLFWRAFYRLCGDRFFIGLEQKYSDPMAITNKYLQKLRIKGINRQMLFDNWLLEIREVWK